MGDKPYMEIGVGLDNILTFLRLEYFWRLTYRDKPGCPNPDFVSRSDSLSDTVNHCQSDLF